MDVNFSLTNKNDLRWILVCGQWEREFFFLKCERTMGTSRTGQSTHRAQGEESSALVTVRCHSLPRKVLLLTYGKIQLSDIRLVVIIFIT